MTMQQTKRVLTSTIHGADRSTAAQPGKPIRNGQLRSDASGAVFMNVGSAAVPRWLQLRDVSVVPAERAPDTTWVPTPRRVIASMFKLAGLTSSDVLYDLGCGDGRIVVAAAKAYGCRAIGIDIDPRRIAAAHENVRRGSVGHLVDIRQQDLFTVDLSEATVITLYILRSMNKRLIPTFQQLPPGVRIVAHDFDLGNVPPHETVKVTAESDGKLHSVMLWRTPISS